MAIITEDKLSYRQIIKSTSLFGGVQIINIIVSIIRNKFIAILLGPAGMGYAGLITTSTSLISGLTTFGINVSAIKDISQAENSNPSKLPEVIFVFKKLLFLTGILGTLFSLIFSPWLGEITFGNQNYRFTFALVSITLLINQINSGYLAIFQGLRKLKYLAKASTFGAIAGLLVTIPIYFFWGVDGVIPAIVITSLTSFIIISYFNKKIKIDSINVPWFHGIAIAKNFLSMGMVISITGLLSVGTSYLLAIYINDKGGTSDVGLYNAGFAIINSYVGMIFTAMLTDYYPRLSSVVSNTVQCNKIIQQQADIAILLLTPIIATFLIFITFGIMLLLSSKFLLVIGMLNWAIMGVLFKAASWPISIIFIPKGDSKLFLINEVIANIYTLVLNLIGYHYWGLEGLGVSYLLVYIIYFFQVTILAKLKYNFNYQGKFFFIFIIQLCIILFCFTTSTYITNLFIKYSIGIILILASIVYSYIELNKRIGLKSYFSSVFNRAPNAE